MNIRTVRRAGLLGLVAMGLAATMLTAGPAKAADSVSASIVGRTLNITGSGHADDVVLRVATTDTNTLLLDIGNDGTTDGRFTASAIDAIDVTLGGGGDRFSANGVPMPQTSHITGGGGDDNITGTAGVDVITGGGNDTISAGAGDDVITGGGGDDFVVGGLGHDVAFLGGGADVFLWNPGEGSDDVNGGGGTDVLLFNGAAGAETMDLSPAGTRAVFSRQPGNVVMNLDDVEILDLHALGGADLITVNDTTGTSLRRADIDLSAAGNGGAGDEAADAVTVNGTNADDVVSVVGQGTVVDVTGLHPETRITGTDVLDHLQLNTLDGNDTATVDPSALALIGVTVDLGAGQI